MRHILPLIPMAIAAPLHAEPPRIVTDTAITASFVRQVTGEQGQVEILLSQGANPHDFQLRPSQARALQHADLLIWTGPELTPWLERAADSLDDSAQLQLLEIPGTELRSYAPHDDTHEDQHSDHTAHDHNEGEDDHDHDGIDPHAWLNPDNGALWLDHIAEQLGARDPANAQHYRDNAGAAKSELSDTVAEIRAMFPANEALPFVTFHDAYGYFTEYFYLPPAIAVSLGDATAPSAARLNEVREEITGSEAVCAFPETNQPLQLIETAIEGTGLSLGESLSPAGDNFSSNADYYANILMQLAKRISACEQGQE
ncbi:zinc ABC transporter substrate-binding protein [Paracoccus aerodenitrificans]|uniref:zinc ABC transporter substrate-binding protein n=1 Tax=Paracoccus aerodenitrificans TaxID=3017781 RepID=UPI0022F118A7|nr:zinc ABC transporter substrate-binding protein [Paracoccus aerodenitrificans]WBU62964.1 zinc ABC transporter substrate-binding protein [Paracoccus aerodenitrificans]